MMWAHFVLYSNSFLFHLFAITEVVVKSVLAIIDSLGISVVAVGNNDKGVITGCQALSLAGSSIVPGRCCCN